MQKTKVTQISGTVFFKHKYLSKPTITPANAVAAAAQDMAAALKGHMARHLGAEAFQHFDNLQNIFAKAANTNDIVTKPLPTSKKQKRLVVASATQAVEAAGPKQVVAVSNNPAPINTSPCLSLAAAPPPRVPPFPTVGQPHPSPGSPLAIAPQRVSTTPPDPRVESLRRLPRLPSAAKEETPRPPAPAVTPLRRSVRSAAFATKEEEEEEESPSPAMRTRRKLRAGAQESMLSCFDVSHSIVVS